VGLSIEIANPLSLGVPAFEVPRDRAGRCLEHLAHGAAAFLGLTQSVPELVGIVYKRNFPAEKRLSIANEVMSHFEIGDF
jgi:hypothetical protein